MAKFTITISDEDSGIAVSLAGPAEAETAAAAVAQVVMRFVPEIVKRAAKELCQCEDCKTKRESNAATVH